MTKCDGAYQFADFVVGEKLNYEQICAISHVIACVNLVHLSEKYVRGTGQVAARGSILRSKSCGMSPPCASRILGLD